MGRRLIMVGQVPAEIKNVIIDNSIRQRCARVPLYVGTLIPCPVPIPLSLPFMGICAHTVFILGTLGNKPAA